MDKEVEAFRNRPLTGSYAFLTVDATYFKVRENHRIISRAFIVALGTNEQGQRKILGFDIYPEESADTWKDFLRKLRKRGLTDLLMITSDARKRIINAIVENYPSCTMVALPVLFSRNISEGVSKKYQAVLRAELQDMFNSQSNEEAREKHDAIIAEYHDIAENAMVCLDEGFESCITAQQGCFLQGCIVISVLPMLLKG